MHTHSIGQADRSEQCAKGLDSPLAGAEVEIALQAPVMGTNDQSDRLRRADELEDAAELVAFAARCHLCPKSRLGMNVRMQNPAPDVVQDFIALRRAQNIFIEPSVRYGAFHDQRVWPKTTLDHRLIVRDLEAIEPEPKIVGNR